MTVEKETTREDWDRLRKQYPAIDPEESNVAEGVFQGTDEELEEAKEFYGSASTSPTPPKPINTTGMFGSLDDKTQWKVDGSVAVQPIDTQEKLKTHELPKEAREDIKGMTPDMVNHPSHYTYGKVECIDAIEESMTTEAFRGYCKGAAMKYLWRYERKGKPLEDLQKAQWYLVKLISSHQ